jgi:sulfotransferase
MRANYDLPEVKSQDPLLMQKAFLSACKGVAEGYYSELTTRTIVCDKNRGWSHYYEWVEQWSAEPKMICMVRDLRSVISSMEKAYRANRHKPSGPDNPAQLQGMTVGQRAQHWLSSQPVGLALQRTADCFQRGVAKNLLFIRYEDFTRDPQGEMNKVYDFIGEERFTHDFSNLKKEVYEDDSHFGVYGSHRVAPKVTPSKARDWEDVLPKEVAQAIRQNHNWYFETLGY